MVANNHVDTQNGHMVTLNIHVPQANLVQPIQFDSKMVVSQVCRAIHEHLSIPMDQDRKLSYALSQ